ncbi:sialate O-acetylesterase [Bythopirellula polymerisocia]|uniref:Sialate O-acetylesterase domain-containing protein n=1 Tax=Bythopirellula polymerisocia TaxID=2528003 RepID=A0A5C6CV73_9BACT|nr:sialate O-acetylesterase [Bythopirellula polymerisocia]TWU28452.1 hypothetical protein Pla144_17420 [Bythopirellula polymerisocia]
MTKTIICYLAAMCWSYFAEQVLAEVAIRTESSPLSVSSQEYQARIEADGCLTNLRIGGHEFLAPGVSISRGSYFFSGGPLQLSSIEQAADNIVTASNETAAIRYGFDDAGMTWQLTNKSDNAIVFFMVLSKDVNAAFNHEGQAFMLPVNESWTEVTLVEGDSLLKIHGCDKLWGPWQGPHQVCQVSLEPHEEKTITLSVGEVTPELREQIRAITPKLSESKLQVFSPREHQVFQRSSAAKGMIFLNGHTTTHADAIRFRITGSSIEGPLSGKWQTLPLAPETSSFSGTLPLAAGGWYALNVQALKEGEVLAESTVEPFGVGEVFVGAGQSNSTNCGEICTQQTSGMVASFSGTAWQLANDPQPGVADRSQGGSFWPAFGDAMYARFGVPIGVAATGYGGTSVNQWQPDGDLFPWMMTRMYQLGPRGFRALLWHQGESDVEMPSEEYYDKLRHIILSSRTDVGGYVPWFVAQASYHNPEKPSFKSVRSAQARLWKEGIALEGPDTDTLTGDRRDLGGAGIHFSPKGLSEHGRMWADLVGDYIDSELEIDTGNGSSATATAWPEADALFHRDPSWLGGDDAYSLDLGDGRVAWFFGDSFVAPTLQGERRSTTMVRNSVGIQTGYEPTSAEFEAYWQEANDKPQSFIADEGEEFFWPGGSLLLDGKILMLMMRARNANRKMAFETTGWGAVLIDNIQKNPDQWKIRKVDAPPNRFDVLVGSATLIKDGEYVFAYSVASESHDVYLVRWRLAKAAQGDLSAPEWWTGSENGWVDQKKLDSLPAPVIKSGQTEFTVHFSPNLNRYVQVQFSGFPLAPIGLRTARSLTGPWTELEEFCSPEEMQPGKNQPPDAERMLYAAKAHPELASDGLAMTYCSNTFDIKHLIGSLDLYFPRFLQVKFSQSKAP